MTAPTQTWSPTYTTAPPASCQTLRNYRNTVAWGQTCVFAEEDNGGPKPFSINTACMPWVTPGIYPASGAVYGPATACPSSWNAVSTGAVGKNEVELSCCPPGFEGDGRSGCRVKADSGRWNVVECGDADAEENENRVYEAGQWPATATISVDALRLRGVGSANSSAPASTGGSNGNAGGGGGLSTATKAAIGTVIPLVFVLGALALLVFWRRRKHKKAALALAKRNISDEKPAPSSSTSNRGSYHQPYAQPAPLDSKTLPVGAVGAAGRTGPNTHEIPEWNVEMDATDAERQRLVPNDPMSATSNGAEASELAGLGRVPRKPIAPVELDGTSARAEVGDAYLPYRPGAS
jgi:hypothetical protein